MAGQMIVGVDFSGARNDENTWMTEGKLEGAKLEIACPYQIKRSDLTEYLKSLKSDTVAGLDFPFGIPIAFAKYLGLSQYEMPDSWSAIAKMSLREFIDKRNGYVGENREKEHLRAGDLWIPGCYSCLHNVNPNMVPMTFYGMKMLHELWESGCRVPPLPDPVECDGPELLETMPGAVLWSLALPSKNSGKAYKKRDEAALTRRREILDHLCAKSKINLPNLKGKFTDMCLENHDCLDSVVAAVAAAMWAKDKSRFKHPSKDRTVSDTNADPKRMKRISHGVETMIELQAARREGWIYAPARIAG